MDIALYQPDIPHNTGALIRLAACMGTTLHIIEPAGFRLDDKALKRSALDYEYLAALRRHISWDTFLSEAKQQNRRLILATTKAGTSYLNTAYDTSDIMLFGRESSGVPENVHQTVDLRVTIPMMGTARSLNLALSAAMILGEGLRQTRT
jgi:tRNA (cytidine/uridine-2'-O-)-methyltransferase